MQKKTQTIISIRKSSSENHSFQKIIPKIRSQPETSKFNKCDLVWAKITGYPWWPAIITSLPGEKSALNKEEGFKNKSPQSAVASHLKADYRVDFIADQTHAFLKKNFILGYIQNRDRLYAEGLQFSIRKRRFFQMAINEADQLIQVLQISKLQTNQKENQQKNQLQQQKNFNFQPIDSACEFQQSKKQNEKKEQKSLAKEKNIKNQTFTTQKNHLEPGLQNANKVQSKSVTLLNKTDNNQNNNYFFSSVTQKRKGRPPRSTKINFIKAFEDENQQKNNSAFQNIIQDEAKLMDEKKFHAQKKSFFLKNEAQNMRIFQKVTLQEQIYLEQQLPVLQHFKADSGKDSFQIKQNQTEMINLLKKYKLDTVDDIENQYKTKNTNNSQRSSFFYGQNRAGTKGNQGATFVKDIFLNLNKKKISKKNQPNKNHSSELIIFKENFQIQTKMKEGQENKLTSQRSHQLVEYCQKSTARKIYKIVSNILKKKNINCIDENLQRNIRQRCVNMALAIFSKDGSGRQNRNLGQNGQKNLKRKLKDNSQNTDFINLIKKKIQQSLNFLRFFSLQNWYFVTKIGGFSTELCILVRSFEQFLEKQCHLNLKNQQKLEDIVKKVGIQNEKTSFALHYVSNQMQIENEYSDLSAKFFGADGTSQFKQTPPQKAILSQHQ